MSARTILRCEVRRRRRKNPYPMIMQEVGILKGLNYDRNIVQFYGACLQPGTDPMLVTEFMEGVRDTSRAQLFQPLNRQFIILYPLERLLTRAGSLKPPGSKHCFPVTCLTPHR